MTMTRNSVEFDSNQLSDSNTARLYSKKTEQKKNEHVKSQNNEKNDYDYKKYRKKIDAFQKKKTIKKSTIRKNVNETTMFSTKNRTTIVLMSSSNLTETPKKIKTIKKIKKKIYRKSFVIIVKKKNITKMLVSISKKKKKSKSLKISFFLRFVLLMKNRSNICDHQSF